MEFLPTAIPDVVEVVPDVFADERSGPGATATAVVVALLLGAAIAVGSSLLGSDATRSAASQPQVEQLQLLAGGDSMGKSTGTPTTRRPSGKRGGA